MNLELLEALKWIIAIGATIFIAIGGYWHKKMADDIKELNEGQNKIEVSMSALEAKMPDKKGIYEDIKKLQVTENETKVFIGEMRMKTSEREKLQDERWEGLKKDIASLHRDVSLIITNQFSKKTNNQQE